MLPWPGCRGGVARMDAMTAHPWNKTIVEGSSGTSKWCCQNTMARIHSFGYCRSRQGSLRENEFRMHTGRPQDRKGNWFYLYATCDQNIFHPKSLTSRELLSNSSPQDLLVIEDIVLHVDVNIGIPALNELYKAYDSIYLAGYNLYSDIRYLRM